MKNSVLILLLLSNIFLASCSNPKPKPNEINSQKIYLEDFGFSSLVLSEMITTVKEEDLNVNSVLIVRKGATILNAHFYPQSSAYLHEIASVSKSITSLLVGIAISEGFIKNEEQKVSAFFPNQAFLFDTDTKNELSIKHLLTMTSGICSDFSQGESLRNAMKSEESPLSFILNKDLYATPGDRFTYCSAGVQVLSMIISNASSMSMEDFAKNELFLPLGITEFRFGTDISGLTNASGDIFLKAQDLAKIGHLILNGGSFNGKQVVSKEWIKRSTSKQIQTRNNESYGYLWWIRDDLGGLIEAQGRGGQRLIILPEKDLVVVMYGTGFDTGRIGGFIVKALKADAKITRDEEGNNRLQEQLESIQKPFNVQNQKSIPAIADTIDGKRYVFQNNSLGLTYFKLNIQNPDSAHFGLGLKKHTSFEEEHRKIPMGLNGNYVISNQTRFNTPMAARAEWKNEHTILIDYNEFSNAHKYTITIEFAGNEALFSIQDEADYGGIQKLISKSE